MQSSYHVVDIYSPAEYVYSIVTNGTTGLASYRASGAMYGPRVHSPIAALALINHIQYLYVVIMTPD